MRLFLSGAISHGSTKFFPLLRLSRAPCGETKLSCRGCCWGGGVHTGCRAEEPAMTVVCLPSAELRACSELTPSIWLSSCSVCEYGGVVGVEVDWREGDSNKRSTINK